MPWRSWTSAGRVRAWTAGRRSCRILEDRAFSFAGDEHGFLKPAPGEIAPRIGTKVELYPSHCDTSVNLFDEYLVVRDGVVEDIWPIEARGKTQ